MFQNQFHQCIYEIIRSSQNKVDRRYRCVHCETEISDMADAIDHVEDSVTPKISDIMGNLDRSIKTFDDHPD